jgi:tetratricopeptide (TPR) repeat protein
MRAKKALKPAPEARPAPKAAPQPTAGWKLAAAGALAAALLLCLVYGPVLHAPFVFDDTQQMFAKEMATAPLNQWIGQVRPILMFSYWANVHLSRQDTLSYHAFNLAIHLVAALLMFAFTRKLLDWAGTDPRRRNALAAFGAFLFLLHPLQSESVAYISGRSEALAGMFALASMAAFVWRRSTAISWPTVAAVVLLFGAAVLSKEQSVVVPAVLLLTDFWWNPGFSLKGALRNWKLYALLAAGALAGVARFWSLILGVGTGESAGFAMKAFTWYQYLFTEFRALCAYIANFVFPANLNLDWEFPISHSLLEHGAIVALIALAALGAAAWHYRRRFPLAGYGFFLFVVLLLPTSSILPIKDPIADRRMYLPMIGLTLIAIDLLGRVRLRPAAFTALTAAILLAAAGATYARAAVWSDPVSLWEDTVRKSPGKSRAHFQLGTAYYEAGRYDRASEEFEKAAGGEKPTYDLLVDWGLALSGMNQPAAALAKLRQAASMEATAHIYTQIGKVYADQKQWKEAMEAFDTAQRIDPNFVATYAYQGLVHLANGDPKAALEPCGHALKLDPNFQPAQQCAGMAQQMMRGR